MYFSLVFASAYKDLADSVGISLLTRDDLQFFNLSRFRATTRVQEPVFRELLYAVDDAALFASTAC